MTRLTLLRANLTRNPLRTSLTIAAIALPMFVFTMSRSFVESLDNFFVESDRNMRVAVHQKLTFTTTLPQRMREEILSIAPPDYIRAICRTSWFGGRIHGSQRPFPNMAVDRESFPIVYNEYHLTPEQIEKFQSERRGAVAAKSIADRMNWEEGTKITLKGALPPFPEIECIIVAIAPDIRDEWVYFGLDYYDEIIKGLTGNPVGVHNFWLKCNTPKARLWALTEIDKHFANTDHETRTEMESTFVASFINSQGDVTGMIWMIGRLIVLVAVAVAFNTMSMSFRERTREIAVLRALGFQAGSVMGIVIVEGLLLGLIGGFLAVGLPYLVTNLNNIVVPQMGRVQITTQTACIGLGVAIACGLLAALIPALMAGRLKVVSALRKVA